MPENGLDWLSRKELMSNAELVHLCSMLVGMGIEKIRITGGEPFVRKDLIGLLRSIALLDGLKELSITTNGVLTAPYIPQLIDLGIRSVNLSLDTLDPNRFFAITKRDEFAKVMHTMEELLKTGIEVKINTVVMAGRNIPDIISLAELTKTLPVSVRFIEEMPFNGRGNSYSGAVWDHVRILNELTSHYPQILKLTDPQYSTSSNFHIPGHQGDIGIIAAYSRTFCGTCNRIRIAPEGTLKNCLYDAGVLNVRDLIRGGADLKQQEETLRSVFSSREKNGFIAEKKRALNPDFRESMATIGG